MAWATLKPWLSFLICIMSVDDEYDPPELWPDIPAEPLPPIPSPAPMSRWSRLCSLIEDGITEIFDGIGSLLSLAVWLVVIGVGLLIFVAVVKWAIEEVFR